MTVGMFSDGLKYSRLVTESTSVVVYTVEGFSLMMTVGLAIEWIHTLKSFLKSQNSENDLSCPFRAQSSDICQQLFLQHQNHKLSLIVLCSIVNEMARTS